MRFPTAHSHAASTATIERLDIPAGPLRVIGTQLSITHLSFMCDGNHKTSLCDVSLRKHEFRTEPPVGRPDPLGGWSILTWRRNPMLTRTSIIALFAVAGLSATAIVPTSPAARGGGFGHGGGLSHGPAMNRAVSHGPVVHRSPTHLPIKSGLHKLPI